jgi:hypothetical protein
MNMPSQYPTSLDPDQVAEGRPWWKICCGGCCLGIVVLFVVIPVLLQFVFRSAPVRVEKLPDTYPKQLILFRPEEAISIMYYPAESKGAVTRLLRAPLALIQRIPVPESVNSSTSAAQITEAIQTELRRAEGRDTVAIGWRNLNSSRDNILRFYVGALKQAGMPPVQQRRDEARGVDELLSQRGDLRFSLLLTDDPSTVPVEDVSVVVEYVVAEK